MATAKKSTPTAKLTAVQARERVDELQEKLDKFESTAYCPMCKTHKDRETKFYFNSDPMFGGDACSPICRDCARKIALRVGKDGKEQEPTKESIITALKYLNKPFLSNLWNSSVQESENALSGKTKNNPWNAYVKNVQMTNYYGMTFFDSDFYNEEQLSLASPKENNNNDSNIPDNEIGEQFEQNKKDAIRLLGYDPFENESLSEQPFLYATLIGYLDAAEEANDDRMRLSSIIEIVKGFNHIEKMNDIIARLMDDSAHIESNIGTIKNLEETKSKITASVLKLAADNGISLKHSVNSTKGENTWTGKVRKMKEMNLRDAEVNLYDAEYSAGLSQVADISNASILKQIMLDENDSADMIIQQRELITKYKKIADEYEEKARILLRENIDLKDLIKENGIDIQEV